MRQASLEIEGMQLPDGAEELIRKRIREEISHQEFIQRALEIAGA